MGSSRGLRAVVVVATLAGMGLAQAATPPGTAAGTSWLQAQVQADGSVANASGIATDLQAESETLKTLGTVNDPQAPLTTGLITGVANGDTETLSRQIMASVATGQNTSALAITLLANQNPDGGFGDFPGYQDTFFDTAYALVALNAAGQGNTDAAHNAALYLVNSQGTDGSWTDWQGTDTAYETALAIEAIAPYRLQVAAIALAIRNGSAYLSSVRQAGSDWGASFIDAQVVLALALGNADTTLVTGAAGDLANAQSVDGSWGDDVFTTALALRAEAAVQATAPPTQTSGSATGYVVEAGTGRPIAGASVFLASNSQVTTTTNASGYYSLSNLPVGQLTFVASAAGYNSTSITAAVTSGAATQVGQLVLAQGSSTAMVYGKILSQQNGTPLAGASVQLTGGSAPYSTITAADGSFAFPAVAPGQYTLQIGDTGFITVSGTVTVTPGEQLQADQSLLLTGTYQNSAPVTVSATVVDATSGAAIPGAHLSLGASLAATAGSDGSLSIGSVPLGAYQATVSAGGYTPAVYSVMLTPGSNGALGTLSLYPASAAAPSTLTVTATVVDGLSNKPIVGATVTDTDTGATLTTDANGNATLTGLTTLSANLQVSATGYATQAFTVTASGFGTVAETLALPAAGGTSGATSVSLSGVVTDAATGTPIANATVALSDATAQFVTGSTGSYQLPNIPSLNFSLQVTATGYITQTIPVTLSQFGNYSLAIQLTAAQPASSLQILSVDAKSATLAATDIGVFTATVGNTGSSDVVAALFAEITDSNGAVVADVSGRMPGTSNVPASFDVPPSGQLEAEFDWMPQQLPTGGYTITVYAATPGTATRTSPHGTVLAQGNTTASVNPTDAITGQLTFSPPLSQAGSQTPVAISALVINAGNETLAALPLQLTVTDPATGNVIYTATAQTTPLAVNNNVSLSFGSWLPTTTGNLKVHVTATDGSAAGAIDGTLYVGNKATAQLTIDKTLLPPGNNTVHAKVAIQGVDITQAISVDPLYFAVQRAVTNGGTYVGTNAETWQKTNQCLGCHIQTEGLVGLASSMNKATIDLNAVKFLANAIGTSQHGDSTYHESYPSLDQTQTVIGLWSLNKWPDQGFFFRSKLAAAMYLHGNLLTSGNTKYWYPDYTPTWFSGLDQLATLGMKGFVDLLAEAPSVDFSAVKTYAWGNRLAPINSVVQAWDVSLGPDGLLYTNQQNGIIVAVNPNTGAHNVVSMPGLPAEADGIAVAPDGSIYVSGFVGSNGYIAHGVPGQPVTMLWQGPGEINKIALSPSGVLYAVNKPKGQLLRFDSATPTVVLGPTVLNQPNGLAFDPQGDLMIADQNNFDLVELKADGTESVFAAGIGQPPERVIYDGNGGWYVVSGNTAPLGFSNLRGLYHFGSNGVGERIVDSNGQDGLVMWNGVPVSVDRNNNTLVALTSQAVDPNDVALLQQDVTGLANYLLGRYQDGNTDRTVIALRLMALAEARRVVTDPTLLNSLNTAVATLDKSLRGMQGSDGGWGWRPGNKSDALVTALVGIGLDYSNPSTSDPVTRNAIQFLLNTQQGDGSWLSADGILTTHLGVTGLVMDYLPDALTHLGGIDVDLYLQDVPGKASLGNFVPAPGDTVIGGDGSSTYNWHLTGVTTEEDVGFDVNLPGMLANETRTVAGAAYLTFKNSFTGELLTSTLDIPTVQAVSGLGVTVATDRPQYPAGTPVVISGNAGNSGAPTVAAQVQIAVTAADGTLVASLPAITGLAIPTSGELPYTAQWNTGEYLPGTYTVTASIVDDTGTVANKAVTAFTIANSSAGGTGSSEATLRTSTDRTMYNTSDTVNIADLVASVTDNTLLPLVHLHLVVADPSGNTVGTYDHDLGQLAPGALDTLPDVLALNHAAQGQYSVTGTLTDSTGTVLATGSAAFTVAENLARTLIGQVTVASPSVYQGNPEVCTDTAINNGTLAISNQPLQELVVNPASGTAISTTASAASLSPSQQQQSAQIVDTTSLAVGAYTCVLQAQVNGSWSTLGYATFQVTDPTAALTGTLTATPTQVPVTTPVSLTGTVTDGGNASVPGVTATIIIQDPTGTTVFSAPTTLGALNANQTSQLLANWTATGTIGATYTAILTATVGPKSKTLAEAPFTLLPPPIKLGVSMSGPAYSRLLVLLNCPEGDDEHEGDHNDPSHGQTQAHDDGGDGHDHQADCLTSRSATVNSLLTGLNVSYKLTTDIPSFMQALRSGRYNQYWVLGALPDGDSTNQVGEELEEAVNRGDSLLVDGELDGGHNQELLQIAGASYKGQLPENYQGPASLLAPTFNPASLPTSSGDLNLATTTGTEAASFSATLCSDDDGEGDHAKGNQPHDGHDGDHHPCTPQDVPAIIINAYGQGHGAILGLDLITTLQQDPTAGWQAAIGTLIQALQPALPSAVPPLGYVPVLTTVQNQGVATTLNVVDLLPQGATDVDASPTPSSSNPLSWTAPLAINQSLTFQAGITVPNTPGNYLVTSDVGTLSGGSLTPYGSYTYSLSVRDTAGLEQQLTGELAALTPAHDDDKQRIQDAQHEYQEALNLAQTQDWSDAIGELLEASEDLESLGTPATTARLDLDHLIQALELQWYASGATYSTHH